MALITSQNQRYSQILWSGTIVANQEYTLNPINFLPAACKTWKFISITILCEDLAARSITDYIEFYRGNKDLIGKIPVQIVTENVEKTNRLSQLPLNFKSNFSSGTSKIAIYAVYEYV